MIFFASIFFYSLSAPGESKLEIPLVDHAPTLEAFSKGTCPDEWEGKLAKAEGFTQREPRDGEPASQATVVYLGYDSDYLYAIFQAFDEQPSKVRARLTGREALDGDDTVNIQLDTFSDQRRGYTFICNPLGVQADAIFIEGSGYDFSFNALWYSEGQRTDFGFVVLMKIPFKSLRFPERESQQWGIMLNRDMPRFNEDTFWPRYTSTIQGRLNQAGTLSGIKGVSQGRNYHLVPFAFARSYRTLEDGETPGFAEEDLESTLGLDAKMVLKDRFVLDLTLNPDFSQVESDQPQITVNNRFEVFFPERRPFFLENADMFQTPSQLVFTRRIKDPDWGLRLTGKAGPYAIGFMALNDAAPGKEVDLGNALYSKKANIGILRINRDIMNQAHVGFLMTHRDFGDRTNRVFAIDSRILLSEHWDATMQAGLSETTELSGEKLESGFTNTWFNRNGKNFGAHLHYLTTGDDFRADLGYLGSMQRSGTDNAHASAYYTFWKNKGAWVSWTPSIAGSYVTGPGGMVVERTLDPAVQWTFVGKSSIELQYHKADELLTPDEFSGLELGETFDTQLYGVSLSNNMLNWLGASAEWVWGDGVNYAPPVGEAPFPAQVMRGGLDVTYRPLEQLHFTFNYLFSELSEMVDDANIFSNHIYRGRVNWNFSRRLSVRAIMELSKIETDSQLTFLKERDNLNHDLLLTYLINPWTAVYLGFNSNERNRQLVSMEDRFFIMDPSEGRHHDGRQIFIKCSYLIQ